MLKKLLDIKVPVILDDDYQGTIRTEWKAYLSIFIGFVVIILLTVIAYLNY
jgi:hypothetical protein